MLGGGDGLQWDEGMCEDEHVLYVGSIGSYAPVSMGESSSDCTFLKGKHFLVI